MSTTSTTSPKRLSGKRVTSEVTHRKAREMTRIASAGASPVKLRRLKRRSKPSVPDDQERKDLPMNPDFQRIAAQQRIVQGMNKVSHIQSPIVYAALGLVCGSFWALGTSTQVLTSEAWMMSKRIRTSSNRKCPRLVSVGLGVLRPTDAKRWHKY